MSVKSGRSLYLTVLHQQGIMVDLYYSPEPSTTPLCQEIIHFLILISPAPFSRATALPNADKHLQKGTFRMVPAPHMGFGEAT